MERQVKFPLWGYVACMVLGGVLVRNVHAGGPSFDLTLAAPASVEGPAGSPVQIDVTGRLTSSGIGTPDGVQGWQISIVTEGWVPVAATTNGTAGALDTQGGLRDSSGVDSSFEKTEIVNPAANGGQTGVVSEVILSFTPQLRTLPPSGTSDIIKLTLEGTAPQPVAGECEASICRVLYRDGLLGSGDPILNAASYRNESFGPTLGSASTRVCPIIVRETNLIVEVLTGTAGPKSGNVAPWKIEVDAPAPATLTVNVDIVLDAKVEPCFSTPAVCTGENFFLPNDPEDPADDVYGCSDMMDNDGDGKTDAEDESCLSVQGFSLSIATGDCFNINRARTIGTVAALTTGGGIRDPDGSFEKTEVVNPLMNSGQQGAVCAVVFSFTKPIGLPAVSRNTVVTLRGVMDTSGVTASGICNLPCLLRILDPAEDGLAGSGEPVKTAVTVAGETQLPGLCNATVQVCGRMIAPEARFLRCDPNNDGKNDIADAIWIVNDLFRMGPNTLCQDAGDCNNDGLFDLSDSIFGIDYQFRGGMVPLQPFPACGTDQGVPDTLPDCVQPSSCP